ncbi:MAG: hypothetical protein EPN71_09035 [Rhodanobacter sp.]|nr:MAG: hypothetical protein EPN71_09035 [Rhodanobacter sp.]
MPRLAASSNVVAFAEAAVDPYLVGARVIALFELVVEHGRYRAVVRAAMSDVDADATWLGVSVA